jgi:hypothetical protein
VGDVDFKVNSAAENSNKFQKTRFWKEKSVEDMVTLGANSTGHTSISEVIRMGITVSTMPESHAWVLKIGP